MNNEFFISAEKIIRYFEETAGVTFVDNDTKEGCIAC